jgi:hypothetical protein
MLPSFGKYIWTVDTWRQAHNMINCTMDGSTLYTVYQETLHLLKDVSGYNCWCTGCIINSVTHVVHSYAVSVISLRVVRICQKLGCNLHFKIPHSHRSIYIYIYTKKMWGQYRDKLLVFSMKSGLRLTTFSVYSSFTLGKVNILWISEFLHSNIMRRMLHQVRSFIQSSSCYQMLWPVWFKNRVELFLWQ